MSLPAVFDEDLGRWLAPFLQVMGRTTRRRLGPLYVQGLLGPDGPKSVQPMAARLGLPNHDQLHHFISSSAWDDAPLWRVLAQQADALVGGGDAVLVVDDTALPKKGSLSVGVAAQYCGELGKQANCQALVSLTLARGEVPIPVGLRLFLPNAWTDDAARCTAAGVPEAARAPRSKPDIALAEIDRLIAAGARFGCVLADAGYGSSAAFRHGLSARGLVWSVGIARTQKVYPAAVELHRPAKAATGRPPTRLAPSQPSQDVATVLSSQRWRRVAWRRGTKGMLAARFAAVRVRVADGAPFLGGRHLPGDEVWLVGEWRSNGERKFYVSNQPPDTPLKQLAATVKARWVCEQGHQQLKQELGLGAFEGRSWTGLHRHALMACIALAYLQHLRLAAVAARGEKAGSYAAAASPNLA